VKLQQQNKSDDDEETNISFHQGNVTMPSSTKEAKASIQRTYRARKQLEEFQQKEARKAYNREKSNRSYAKKISKRAMEQQQQQQQLSTPQQQRPYGHAIQYDAQGNPFPVNTPFTPSHAATPARQLFPQM
jgi:hypothetical protein